MKKWYMSKTLLACILTGVIATLQADTGHMIVNANFELIIVSLIGAILRVYTNQGIRGDSE